MSRSRGFTLLELLLALALLAMTLGLLLVSSVRSAKQVREADAQNHAVLYAENLLDDLGYGQSMQLGVRQGEFVNPRYRWKLRIEPADSTALPGLPVAAADARMVLYRIELEVRWGERRLRWNTLRAAKRSHAAGAL